MKNRLVFIILWTAALAGIFDAGYLTRVHFAGIIPPCVQHVFFVDCGAVLRSSYSVVYGVPLALLGLIHYSVLTILLAAAFIFRNKQIRQLVLVQAAIGFAASLYFVYLQLFVIRAICLYCMGSAVLSTIIFILTQLAFFRERKLAIINLLHLLYAKVAKPIFFRFDPELVHVGMTGFGETVGSTPVVKSVTKYCFETKTSQLAQKICGITFAHPVGLAAGFDYEARLTQTLAPWGFGFQSVGTITNHPYGGNPRPMLGRLPQSRSLMVNKGFKNDGAAAVVGKLTGLTFNTPVGISIGRTNTRELVTQKESVADIIAAFTKFENSKVGHAYYELNISCPNLFGNVSFYPPKNLKELLREVDKLKMKRPIFVKMPITHSDRETRAMLDVICKHSPKGVIFGNLQKDRKNPALVQEEVARFPVGNFSGKPTFARSNELIRLAYRHYHQRLVIIGCGGIFSGADAYEKICLGASLVQLITGMIYEGPQLVASINFKLEELLKKDRLNYLSEAIGSKND